MRSAPTLKSWMTPFSSVAMLEKLALLRIALCSAPVLSRAASRRTSVTPSAVAMASSETDIFNLHRSYRPARELEPLFECTSRAIFGGRATRSTMSRNRVHVWPVTIYGQVPKDGHQSHNPPADRVRSLKAFYEPARCRQIRYF